MNKIGHSLASAMLFVLALAVSAPPPRALSPYMQASASIADAKATIDSSLISSTPARPLSTEALAAIERLVSDGGKGGGAGLCGRYRLRSIHAPAAAFAALSTPLQGRHELRVDAASGALEAELLVFIGGSAVGLRLAGSVVEVPPAAGSAAPARLRLSASAAELFEPSEWGIAKAMAKCEDIFKAQLVEFEPPTLELELVYLDGELAVLRDPEATEAESAYYLLGYLGGIDEGGLKWVNPRAGECSGFDDEDDDRMVVPLWCAPS